MSIKTIFAAALAVALSFGITSCKDDNYLPAEKHEISQKEDFKPYVGPTVRMNASFDVTYNAKKSRDFDLSFKNNAKGDHSLLQVQWKPGKSYRLLCCLRAKSQEFIDKKGVENNGEPNSRNKAKDGNITPECIYFYLQGTVSNVSADKTSGTMRVNGRFDVPAQWIAHGAVAFDQNQITRETLHFNQSVFIFPDMYFSAYVLSDGCNAETMRQDGKDYPTGKMTFTPDKMFAVAHSEGEAPTMKAVFGIPFTRVKLSGTSGSYTFVKFSNPTGQRPFLRDDYYPGKPQDSVSSAFAVKAVGSVLHFQLRNRYTQTIRFPKDKTLSCVSYFLMGAPITYNFEPKLNDPSSPAFDTMQNTDWNTTSEPAGKVNPVAAIGTKYFRFSFDEPQGETEMFSHPQTLGINCQFLNTKKDNGQAYLEGDFVYIPSGKDLDLYTFAQVNRYGTGDPSFSVDYSGLDFDIQTKNGNWKKVPKTISTLCYVKTSNSNYPMQNSASHAYEIPFNRFEQSSHLPDPESLKSFRDGMSYRVQLKVRSDLMIAEVGYRWDNVLQGSASNQGLIEIYNPTLDDISLHEYYLAKIVYPHEQYGATFKSNDDKSYRNLAYALLCPLVRQKNGSTATTVDELSPAGYSSLRSVFKYGPNQADREERNKAKYTVIGGGEYPQSIEGDKVIIWGGRYFAKNTFTSKQPKALLEEVYNKQPRGSKVDFVSPDLSSLQNFIGVSDGYSNDYFYRPGYSSSGVFGRGNGNNSTVSKDRDETLNGWALIKRVDMQGPDNTTSSRFYVLDTYGACPNSAKNSTQQNHNAENFVKNFGGTEGSPFLFVRNTDIYWPQGSDMDTNIPTPVSGPNNTYKLSATNSQWTKFQGNKKDNNDSYNLTVKAPLALGTRYWK